MLLCALESATELVGVALAEDGAVRCEIRATGRRRHTETLLPALEAALRLDGRAMTEIAAVAVDVGPGLFTGLRVGVATAKGLAQGLGIGVVGVSSLDALAAAAADSGWPGPVVAVIDARRGEVFAARYEGPGAGPSEGPELLGPEELARRLARPRGDGPLLLVGDGARRYGELLAGEGRVLAGVSLASPTPGAVALLAGAALAGGARPEPPEAVVPSYLREADARINWATRTGAGRGG